MTGVIRARCRTDSLRSMKQVSASRAVDVLMAEHRQIERVLTVLREVALRALQTSVAPEPDLISAFVRFAEQFSEGRHHEKEERVLFVEMQTRGFSGKSGPLACMLGQHETGRRLTSVLRHWTHGTPDERRQHLEGMAHAALDYVEMLSAHISVEDSVLFPAALAHLPHDSLLRIADAYRDIDPPSWHEELTAAVDEVVALVLATRSLQA